MVPKEFHFIFSFDIIEYALPEITS